MTGGTLGDTSVLTQIVKTFKEKQAIAICLPAQSPLDVVAAALALDHVLRKEGKNSVVVCAVEPDPTFGLPGQEYIQEFIIVEGDVLIVSIPYKDGNVDNVTYNVEGDTLNILITPEEGHARLQPDKVSFAYTGGKPDVIVTLYAPTLQSLGVLYESHPEQFGDTEIINIDRHFTNNEYGTINMIDKKSPSITQMVNDIFRAMRSDIDKDVASLMLTGLVSATNNFSSHGVNAQTFRMAAYLLEQGAVKKIQGNGAMNMPSSFAQPVGPLASAPVAPEPVASAPVRKPEPMLEPEPKFEPEPVAQESELVSQPLPPEPNDEPLQLRPQIFKGADTINKG